MEYKQKMTSHKALQSTKVLLVMIMFIGFMAILPLVSAFDWIGTTAYYNFNNITGKLVDSVGIWNLTEIGTVPSASGIISNARGVFTSANFFEKAYGTSPLNFDIGNFTISLWINASGNAQTYAQLIGNQFPANPAGTGGIAMITSNPETRLRVYLGNATSEKYLDYTPADLSGWKNFVVKRAGTNVSIWWNGIAVNSTTSSINTTSSIMNTTIGNAHYIAGGDAKPFGGYLDEIGIWNRSLTDAEIVELYNSGAGLLYGGSLIGVYIYLISPTTGYVFSDVGANFTINGTISPASYNFTNVTYTIWYANGTLFNQTSVDMTGANNQTTLYIDSFSLGNYKWNANFCYKNSSNYNCTWSNNGNFTFSVGVSVNNLVYNTKTYETKTETFTANLTILPNSQISLIQLIYNGTNYTITNFTVSNSHLVLSKTIDIPLNINPFANETKSFFFRFNFNLFSQDTLTYSQNVSFINFQVCNGTYAIKSLNFTVKNETIPLVSIADYSFGGSFNYWISSGSGLVYKNYSLQNSSVSTEAYFCLFPINNTLKINANIDYSATGYSSRSYYLRQAEITNITNPITLYLLDSGLSTSIIINVKDKYLTNLKNHLVKILRYYPGLGAYYLVEIAKTDDFGNSLIKAQEEDIDYRIQIENSTGGQIYSSNPMRIICTASPCKLEFITGSTEHIVQNLVDFANVQYTLTWNNNTGYVNFEFSDISGLTQSMRLLVVQIKNYGEVTICDQVITGASGISSCYIGANATGEYMAKVYRTASPAKYFASLSIGLSNIWQTFGTEGLVWMFMFMVIMFFTGLAVGPAAAGIMTVAGFIFMMATGIVYMPWIVVVSIIVVVIIFIIKMRS